MYFYLLHIKQLNDSSVMLYGHKIFSEEKPKTFNLSELKTERIKIKIDKIFSPVYFYGKDLDSLKKEISDFCIKKNILFEIEEITKKNYFNESLPENLKVLKLCSNINFMPNTLKSTNIISSFKEFTTPLENIIISKKIMGPGLIYISDYQENMHGEISVENINFINFLENTEFPFLTYSYISVKIIRNEIIEFCMKIIYNKEIKNYFGFVKGTNLRENKSYEDFKNNYNQISQFKNEFTSVEMYKNFEQMKLKIKEILISEKVDICIFHNLHENIYKNYISDEIIICDLFVVAPDFIKGRDYSLEEICKTLDIKLPNKNYKKSLEIESFFELERNCGIIIESFKILNILDLYKQMTEISGNLLSRTFQNQRAERIEYFLLHEFYEKGWIFPKKNKLFLNENEKSIFFDSNQENDRNREEDRGYKGGLVLNPNRGFYETLVLLLDFNSLYPSIIQEFNVCFSTVGIFKFNEKNIENDLEICNNSLNKEVGILPKVLKRLTERRKVVKELILNSKNENEKKNLNIRQKALKLTANSIYGCLGSVNSRFYNLKMASFITFKGREILTQTKSIAENKFKLNVIYGDTDSLMIDTNLSGINSNYNKSIEICNQLVKSINILYKNIEFEIERVFKKLILYTKKKYACLCIDSKGNSFIETKGLDMVRRDFSKSTFIISTEILNILLMDMEVKENYKLIVGTELENMTENIFFKNNENKKIAELILEKLVDFKDTFEQQSVENFIINAAFSKNPENYPSTVFPHVSLALRLKENGIIYKKDDVISYVIGIGDKNTHVSKRAYLPNERYKIDFNYYIEHQVLPSLFRLLSLYKGIHHENINKIFGVIKPIKYLPTKNITFITKCCETVQEASKNCKSCNKEIHINFYINKITEILRKKISNLYLTDYKCTECNLKYDTYTTVCYNCNFVNKYQPKNYEFDQFLYSVYVTFKELEMNEVSNLVLKCLNFSEYRKIDLEKYFGKEFMNYCENKNVF
ncbi:catalytic subunit alpha of DNA polymerase [Hamiltosporidium tvaerminnensis]|uniref:DNA polymerase n=2 Tax=Hamiltosporidium tvaerminnensis TaxID=1176355 RepID=A0A4Q9L276_9MICR|nr:catalytic subunit alpha of DNA polymerase [Hamiltosporidium tvaerminnensis]